MKTDLTVAGYIFHADTVLLIHHNKLDLWLPVGGHIDPDETPDIAMVREAKEETNLDIQLLNKSSFPVMGNMIQNLATPFFVDLHSVGDHNHCGIYYICTTSNINELQINKELKGARWFTIEEIKDEIIPQELHAPLAKAFEIYNSNT